jgi:hypothetical protein
VSKKDAPGAIKKIVCAQRVISELRRESACPPCDHRSPASEEEGKEKETNEIDEGKFCRCGGLVVVLVERKLLGHYKWRRPGRD